MKAYFFSALIGSLLLSTLPASSADSPASSVVQDTAHELFGGGDFDGDGRRDLVIVDKETGKYRLGFFQESGLFNWVENRPSGLKGLSGFTVGKLLAGKNAYALGFTAADANELSVVDVSSQTAPGKPLLISFDAALGPNSIVAIDIGGEGNTPVADLFVSSIYNSPDENLATLLRNDGATFPKIGEAALPGPATHANRLALKAGGAELLVYVVKAGGGSTLRVEDLSSGKAVAVASAAGLPESADYELGNFRGTTLSEFLVYKPGESKLFVRPVTENGGKLEVGKGTEFDLGKPLSRVVTLDTKPAPSLLVIFGQGETAAVFSFDGVKAPALRDTFYATNEQFVCAAPTAKGLVLFSQPVNGKYSTRYRLCNAGGEKFAAGPYGSLPTLADNDNVTVPEIHARIAGKTDVKSEAEMGAYTNTIPGTRVVYAMMPIPGGEFTMGSPATEPGRKADEGPQHTVKIAPFWMAKCEITWNEYELFMYPDDERRTRSQVPTDAAGDKLADAVTHPSKPYVEMSFGMGKDGFPAIAMTQHAANKYCQWLSAKTGHFYRLPTEAEWEYAARAGTTTAYYFGDDASKIGEYAWYEQNSDFKYQKVGKKKPNAWGLHDICGNVVEWVIDQYDPEYYTASSKNGTVVEPWNKATKAYPHSVRGGSWDDEAGKLRSAARRGSDRAWKMQDPQLPKSVWYFSDAQFVGFRIVRPLKVPSAEEMQKYWTSGVERD